MTKPATTHSQRINERSKATSAERKQNCIAFVDLLVVSIGRAVVTATTAKKQIKEQRMWLGYKICKELRACPIAWGMQV